MVLLLSELVESEQGEGLLDVEGGLGLVHFILLLIQRLNQVSDNGSALPCGSSNSLSLLD